jgi:hypothetical protein
MASEFFTRRTRLADAPSRLKYCRSEKYLRQISHCCSGSSDPLGYTCRRTMKALSPGFGKVRNRLALPAYPIAGSMYSREPWMAAMTESDVDRGSERSTVLKKLR